jgi:catechol 2,3-dioxygenase-like lactoylglutathione lyase family enzyme
VSQTAGTAEHTVASFGVGDVPAVVETLRRRGVQFEEYDTPQIKTEGGIATFGPVRVAWFRDIDGNILGISSGMASGAVELADAYLHPTIPASDLERAESFYTDVLRLPKPSPDSVDHGLIYTLEKSFFRLYPSPGAGSSSNTAAGFTVEGIEELVAGLRKDGIVFEEYDLPTMKTVDGVADLGVAKAAWMLDSEGNLIGLVQLGG